MDNIEMLKIKADENKLHFVCNKPLKNCTSFKIGGDAKLFFTPEDSEELQAVLRLCKKYSVKYLIIGNGSNLLISDDGFDGAIISLGNGFKRIELIGDTTVFCGAAVSLGTLCSFAEKHGLAGLEFAYGIPGSAGGAAYMNAGAYGGEMKDVLLSCSHIDSNLNPGEIGKDDLELSYRHSFYSDKDYVITGITLKLTKDDSEKIKGRMEDYLSRRKSKQPLEYPSAGSVFKRPNGYFAGALIEQSGLKGKQIGGAQVSEKHAGFIVNKGGATAKDVCELIKYIQDSVKAKFGVDLECEIKRI